MKTERLQGAEESITEEGLLSSATQLVPPMGDAIGTLVAFSGEVDDLDRD
jgi:hypothetical protein